MHARKLCTSISRRQLLLGAAACATLSSPIGHAQARARAVRIGVLTSGGTPADLAGADPTYPSMRAFLAGLRDLGYRPGTDVILVARAGGGRPEQYESLALEIVRARVDVIVVAGPTVSAVRRATSTIPIVMVGGAEDPVREGYVASLSRPGGNITGLTLQQVDVAGKRLELVKELVPGSAPTAVLWETTSEGSWQELQSVARTRQWKLLPYQIAEMADIDRAFRSAKTDGAASAVVASGGVLFSHAAETVRRAAAQRLPAIYALRTFVEEGGLMCYSANLNELWRRAAGFVDRILEGAKPAVTPVEQPTRFDLVINLLTARTMGLAVPQSLLLRADELLS